MIRQELLVEALISRTATRSGPVFIYRKPQGPPTATDEPLDRWLHKTTQAFDFTPILLGDQNQAMMLAQHYLDHLKLEARRAGLDWQAVAARLKQVSPHLRRSLLTFSSVYDARLRT